MSTEGPYDPTMQQPAAPPPDEPQGRWPLAIAALIALIAILLIVFVLVSNDDDDDTLDAASTSTTAAVGTTTTEAESTTTTKAQATTSTAGAPAATVAPGLCKSSPPDDPEPTALVVYQAYTLGDENCADKLMTASARSKLFAIPGKGGGWTFQGCTEQDVPDPHTDCAFTFAGGATHFRMNYGTGGWEVYDVYQTTD